MGSKDSSKILQAADQKGTFLHAGSLRLDWRPVLFTPLWVTAGFATTQSLRVDDGVACEPARRGCDGIVFATSSQAVVIPGPGAEPGIQNAGSRPGFRPIASDAFHFFSSDALDSGFRSAAPE
jgi:hypothetical protein